MIGVLLMLVRFHCWLLATGIQTHHCVLGKKRQPVVIKHLMHIGVHDTCVGRLVDASSVQLAPQLRKVPVYSEPNDGTLPGLDCVRVIERSQGERDSMSKVKRQAWLSRRRVHLPRVGAPYVPNPRINAPMPVPAQAIPAEGCLALPCRCLDGRHGQVDCCACVFAGRCGQRWRSASCCKFNYSTKRNHNKIRGRLVGGQGRENIQGFKIASRRWLASSMRFSSDM